MNASNGNANTDFLEFIRNGDWDAAMALVRDGRVSSAVPTASESVFSWLIELDAPTAMVVELLDICVRCEAIDPDTLGLLGCCLDLPYTTVNTFETFCALLRFGLNPNVMANSSPLLRTAMRFGRTREVAEMLKYNIDPFHLSVMGPESTSNLEQAVLIGNQAAMLVIAKFRGHDLLPEDRYMYEK
jgi:hypothetical protein